MGEGLVVVDEKGEILSYNKSALKLLGASEVPYGTSIFEVNGDEVFRETVESALGGTKRRVKIRRGDKVLRFLAGPVSTKEYGGAVIVILDITDTEEKESLRREFTSNVSHELKTPLTSIYGISEIMAGGIVKPEDMRGFAYDINKETGRLIRLVNDIIKLSQLDEGSTTLEKEQVDLMSVVKEVRERLKMVYRKNGIEFNVEGHSAVVSGVHGILSEMIYNLCDNAIKYNREGGSVTVTVDTYKGRPRVKVEDTGIGIPPEAKERVFERFYRVDKSHSKEIGGTGLGLSIVKHGAAFHSADVKLESEYGRGTTVEIRF
jgi:two-component system phosphate regulon sensor histidine kinase PhoR